MRFYKKLIIAAVTGLFITPLLAASSYNFSDQEISLKPKSKPWLFSTDLYLWAINMDGTATLQSNIFAVKQNFRDMFHNWRVGGVAELMVSRGRYGMFINGLYTELKIIIDNNNTERLDRNSFGIISGGLSYRALRHVISYSNYTVTRSFDIVPFAGARYTGDNSTVSVNNNDSQIENHGWTQPMLGARFIFQFARHWDIYFSPDFSYWNKNEKTVNLVSMLQYSNLFGVTAFSANLGYRYLYQYYQRKNDVFKWDMKLFGPTFGFSLTI